MDGQKNWHDYYDRNQPKKKNKAVIFLLVIVSILVIYVLAISYRNYIILKYANTEEITANLNDDNSSASLRIKTKYINGTGNEFNEYIQTMGSYIQMITDLYNSAENTNDPNEVMKLILKVDIYKKDIIKMGFEDEYEKYYAANLDYVYEALQSLDIYYMYYSGDFLGSYSFDKMTEKSNAISTSLIDVFDYCGITYSVLSDGSINYNVSKTYSVNGIKVWGN